MVEQHDPGVVVGVGDGVKGRHHYAPLLPVSPLGLALVEVPGEAALAKIGVDRKGVEAAGRGTGEAFQGGTAGQGREGITASRVLRVALLAEVLRVVLLARVLEDALLGLEGRPGLSLGPGQELSLDLGWQLQ